MHAHAQQASNVDIIPSQQAKENGIHLDHNTATHPPLKISPDKSEILMLDEEAGTIIVGNPAHLNVLADSADRLILVPRAPGASFFTVLNKNGDVLMQRHILIAAPQKNYLRVRRSCGGDSACQPTSVYYCPDTCHDVSVVGADAPAPDAPSGDMASPDAAALAGGAQALSGGIPEAQDAISE